MDLRWKVMDTGQVCVMNKSINHSDLDAVYRRWIQQFFPMTEPPFQTCFSKLHSQPAVSHSAHARLWMWALAKGRLGLMLGNRLGTLKVRPIWDCSALAQAMLPWRGHLRKEIPLAIVQNSETALFQINTCNPLYCLPSRWMTVNRSLLHSGLLGFTVRLSHC